MNRDSFSKHLTTEEELALLLVDLAASQHGLFQATDDAVREEFYTKHENARADIFLLVKNLRGLLDRAERRLDEATALGEKMSDHLASLLDDDRLDDTYHPEMERTLDEWVREFPTPAQEEVMERTTVLFVDGNKNTYRCSCGCNVFRTLPATSKIKLKYACNACGAVYIGERDD